MRLIRALLEVGRLPVASIGKIIEAVEDEQIPVHEMLGTAHYALASPVEVQGDVEEHRAALERVDRLLAELGWTIAPDAPTRDELAQVLVRLDQLGRPATDEKLRRLRRHHDAPGVGVRNPVWCRSTVPRGRRRVRRDRLGPATARRSTCSEGSPRSRRPPASAARTPGDRAYTFYIRIKPRHRLVVSMVERAHLRRPTSRCRRRSPWPSRPTPAASRPAALRSPARSLLLTVLGEYVLPSGEPVWTSTLLRVTGGLGVEEKAARQALSRLADDGWTTGERSGGGHAGARRARPRAADRGRPSHLLLRPGPRIMGRPLAGADRRGSRDPARAAPQTRTRLSWAGFGRPAPECGSAPASREAEAKQVVEGLGLQAASFSFTGPYSGIGSERTMVEQAWHLGDLAADYERFIRDFSELRPDPGEPVLLAQIRLVHRWRRFPLIDPSSPWSCCHPTGSGSGGNLFNDLHQQWHRPAQRHWATLHAGE